MRVNNAEMIRRLVAIDEQYNKEHGEHLMTEKTSEFLNDILDKYGNDDDVVNMKFNKQLKTLEK